MACEKCECQVDVYQQGLLNVTYFHQFTFISVKLCFLDKLWTVLQPLFYKFTYCSYFYAQLPEEENHSYSNINIYDLFPNWFEPQKGEAFCVTWLKMNEEAVGLWEMAD